MAISGCQPGVSGGSQKGTLINFQEKKGEARLTVFAAVKELEGPFLWMKINSLEVLSDGNWYPLTLARQELMSREIRASGQILLARGGLPVGTYQALRFSMEKAAIERDGKQVFLALDNPVATISFPVDVTLGRDDSTSLFLTWDTENSLDGTAILRPRMNAGLQRIPIVTDLAYVSCPDLDTVYIVRTDTNVVCGSIGISGKPGSIVADVARNRLYVLAPQDSAVKVLELTSNREIDQIRLPFTIKPTFMAVNPDGKWAYLLDETGNNLLSLNLQSGIISTQVRLGSRPKYVLYSEELNQLAVSSSYGQKVFFLDPVTLATVGTIDTGGSPEGLLVQNNNLYVAESTSNAVSVFELPGGRSKARLNVGNKPRRFVYNNNQIYVANFGGGSISIIRPGQLSVSRDIRVGGSPFAMDAVRSRQWLYVLDTSRGTVVVIDLSSNRVVKRIELGAVPDDLFVIN
ncbi:MAG: YncE family protein [Pseudomonadota bacterium]